MSYQQAEVRQN